MGKRPKTSWIFNPCDADKPLGGIIKDKKECLPSCFKTTIYRRVEQIKHWRFFTDQKVKINLCHSLDLKNVIRHLKSSFFCFAFFCLWLRGIKTWRQGNKLLKTFFFLKNPMPWIRSWPIIIAMAIWNTIEQKWRKKKGSILTFTFCFAKTFLFGRKWFSRWSWRSSFSSKMLSLNL